MAFPQIDLDLIKSDLHSIKSRLTEEISTKINNVESFTEALEVFSILNDKGLPIDEDFRSILSKSFKSCYKDANPNLIFPNLKIKWSILSQLFGFPNPQFGSNEGVGFFNLINDNNELTYVIAKAKRIVVNGQHKIEPTNPTGPYTMLSTTNDSGIQISKNQFDNYRSLYENNLKLESLVGSPVLNASDYFHPLLTFHDGADLIDFFFHNFPQGSTVPTNLDLVVEHGASFPTDIQERTGSNTLNNCLHTAMVFFGINGALILDNTHNPTLKFKNKGLDVGRLCPPDC